MHKKNSWNHYQIIKVQYLSIMVFWWNYNFYIMPLYSCISKYLWIRFNHPVSLVRLFQIFRITGVEIPQSGQGMWENLLYSRCNSVATTDMDYLRESAQFSILSLLICKIPITGLPEMGNYWSISSEEGQEEWIGNSQFKCSCLLTVINATSSFLALLVVQTNSCD